MAFSSLSHIINQQLLMPDARQLPRTISVKLLPDGKVIMTKGILMNFHLFDEVIPRSRQIQQPYIIYIDYSCWCQKYDKNCEMVTCVLKYCHVLYPYNYRLIKRSMDILVKLSVKFLFCLTKTEIILIIEKR